MKTYNIIPVKTQVADFEISALSLGERGRGRNLTIVPCPDGAELLEPGLSKTGKPRLNKSQSSKGWILRISTNGTYVRGADGNVSTPAPEDWKVVARGQGAFGAAGRTGTWDDLIIATQKEEFILRVKPTRSSAYVLWADGQEIRRLSYEEAEALDLDVGDSTPTSRGDWTRL